MKDIRLSRILESGQVSAEGLKQLAETEEYIKQLENSFTVATDYSDYEEWTMYKHFLSKEEFKDMSNTVLRSAVYKYKYLYREERKKRTDLASELRSLLNSGWAGFKLWKKENKHKLWH
jgi:hypothetical protein